MGVSVGFAGGVVALALVVRVVWVQQVLGFLAAAVALSLGLPEHGDFFLLRAYPSDAALLALVALWVLWATREPQWSGRAWARRVAALADGASVALLLSALFATGQQVFAAYVFGQNAAGSADSPTAGVAHLLAFTWPAAEQLALVACAGAWLWVHWQLHAPALKRERQLLGLVFAVLAIACWVVPLVGVVALVAAVALGTDRLPLLGLAGLGLLMQLSGFYYALQWPLVDKAALLAATGAVLAIALWGLRERRTVHAAQRTNARAVRRWAAPVIIALAGAVAVGLVHRDVHDKEQVIAQGQKIYLQLVPRDPRSLMQGDYMALNFEIPEAVALKLREQDDLGLGHNALVVAQLDERGVAKVLRLAQEGEPMAAREIRLPLKRLKDGWTVVTDAYFFPEGLGEPFKHARFGEFRALPDGRALLVGLADEALQPIVPARLEPPEE